MVSISDLKNVSWQCIHFTPPNSIDVLKDTLAIENFYIKECDSSAIKNDQDLFSYIADVLEFPDYFGNNWDSLDECIGVIQRSDLYGRKTLICLANCC